MAALPRGAGYGDGSERPDMEVLFKCLQAGKRFYTVRLNGQDLFTGAKEECERYIEIHNQKVAQEQLDNLRTPRNRPVLIRTYRQLRAHA